MKIVQVHNYYPVRGGGEDSVVDEERLLLEKAGHQIIPFYLQSKEGGLLDLVISALSLIWNPRSYRQLRKLLATEKPDVVHCHNTFPLISPSIYWACKRQGIPVVQTLHNYRLICANGLFMRDGKVCELCLRKSFPTPAVQHRCYRGSLVGSTLISTMLWLHRKWGTWSKAVTRYIALTEFSKSRFVDSGILASEQICVKPNFIGDLASKKPNSSGEEGHYAIFLGRLWPEKGCIILIHAWLKMAEKMEDLQGYRLRIVGDGVERERLEALVTDHPAASSIEFLGTLPREEAVGQLAGARFMVLPSVWYEGFPMNIVESMAMGLPVISSAMGSMKSILEEGHTGLFFEPGNSDDLAKKIQWAIENNTQLTTMGNQARAEFDAKYTAEKNYARLMEIYEELQP